MPFFLNTCAHEMKHMANGYNEPRLIVRGGKGGRLDTESFGSRHSIRCGLGIWVRAAIFSDNIPLGEKQGFTVAEREYYAYHLMRGGKSPIRQDAEQFLLKEAVRMDRRQFREIVEYGEVSKSTLCELLKIEALPAESRAAILAHGGLSRFSLLRLLAIKTLPNATRADICQAFLRAPPA